MTTENKRPGQLRKAPENFLDQQLLHEIQSQGLDDKRRRFLRQSFLMASAASTVAYVPPSFANELDTGVHRDSSAGDPNILVLPAHSTSLGKPVTQAGYGQPSRHENTILKRASPGLTRTQESSHSHPCRHCLASSRRMACILKGTTKAGTTLHPRRIG